MRRDSGVSPVPLPLQLPGWMQCVFYRGVGGVSGGVLLSGVSLVLLPLQLPGRIRHEFFRGVGGVSGGVLLVVLPRPKQTLWMSTIKMW